MTCLVISVRVQEIFVILGGVYTTTDGDRVFDVFKPTQKEVEMRSGGRWVVLLAGGMVCVSALPVRLMSQESSRSEVLALLEYQELRKSAFGAAALEYLFPFAGFAYAGDAGRGALPGGLRIAGVLLMLPALDEAGQSDGWDTEDDLAGVGAIAFLVGLAWGIPSAYRTAQDHNTALLERLRLSAIRVPQRGGIEVAWSLARH